MALSPRLIPIMSLVFLEREALLAVLLSFTQAKMILVVQITQTREKLGTLEGVLHVESLEFCNYI